MFYFDMPADAPIGFATSGQFVARGHPIHPSRRLDTHVLLIGCSGEYPIAQNGREYILSKDTFMLLPAGQHHCGTAPARGEQSHLWCHFSTDEFSFRESEALPEYKGRIVLPEFGRIGNSESYRILFRQLIDTEYRSFADPGIGRSICNSYIKIILSELSDQFFSEQCELPSDKNILLVSRIRQYISDHACEGVRASEVAEHFGYNGDYLSALMRRITGKNLSEYIVAVRIGAAKKLLLETDLRISDVALAVGYADSKYFMRVFHRCEGITPLGYRRLYVHLHINR